MNSPIKLLFVCTGNACRSQMAEAWVRSLAEEFVLPAFTAASAGIEPHGLDPRAVTAMAAEGIDISRQQSKLLDAELLDWADLVITVCAQADRACPVVARKHEKLHLPFPDPAAAQGSAEEVSRIFRQVAGEIRAAVRTLLVSLSVRYHSSDPMQSRFSHRDVEVISRRRDYQGFIPVELLELRHRQFQGGWSKVLRRELAVRNTAVGVLLYDPEMDQLVMVRQFRPGLLDQGQSPWILEVVAGLAAAGEATNDVVQREVLEETNCLVTQILPICDYLNSPGWSTEKVSLVCARVDASRAEGVHGLDSENEDILVVAVPVEEAIAAVKTGRINNAMAIIAIQWLELNRERVRNHWQSGTSR